MQSVKMRAAGIKPPPDLADDARILGGTEHFAAHCASCHGAPGVPRGDIANGLYPKPADLTNVRAALHAGRAVLDREERHQNVRHARLERSQR